MLIRYIAALFLGMFLITGAVFAQAPFPAQVPQAPQQPAQPTLPPPVPGAPMQPYPPQPAFPQPQQQQPQQGRLEYSFRPELSNPEYGQCLQLEKHWKALYLKYYQDYSNVRWLSAGDPNYQFYISQLQGLKQQLDAAWQAFSNKCIYFPRRK
jgi:hypothetical protein